MNSCEDILNLNNEVGDETHCHLIGYVTKQNYRFRGTENPRVHIQYIHTMPLYGTAFKLENRLGVPALGPHQHWALTGECCSAMINDFLIAELVKPGLVKMWLQQGDVISNTVRVTNDIVKEMFAGSVISGFSDFACPARSPDSTILDFLF